MEKKWKKINKNLALIPTTGEYSDWKPQLAEESENRCVYCAILDAELGGIRNFHVEHYKPKQNPDFPEFAELKNDYSNLFYACPICNTFKSDSWFVAVEGDWNTIHFPDPSVFNYGDFFGVNTATFTIYGVHLVGRFLVQRLHLNRFQLVHFRRYETTLDKFDEVYLSIERLQEELKPLVERKVEGAAKHYIANHEVIKTLLGLMREKLTRPLYTPDELRQSKK